MPQPKTPRLKVYKTHIGFSDWVVAAPNQKAALKAWDVRENLFAAGLATLETKKSARELALKTPGVPVPVRTSLKLPKAKTVNPSKPRASKALGRYSR